MFLPCIKKDIKQIVRTLLFIGRRANKSHASWTCCQQFSCKDRLRNVSWNIFDYCRFKRTKFGFYRLSLRKVVSSENKTLVGKRMHTLDDHRKKMFRCHEGYFQKTSFSLIKTVRRVAQPRSVNARCLRNESTHVWSDKTYASSHYCFEIWFHQPITFFFRTWGAFNQELDSDNFSRSFL